MKYMTALRQSQNSVKFPAFVIVGLAALAWKYPGKYTWIPLGLVAAYGAMDAWNIRSIRRRAAEGASAL